MYSGAGQAWVLCSMPRMDSRRTPQHTARASHACACGTAPPRGYETSAGTWYMVHGGRCVRAQSSPCRANAAARASLPAARGLLNWPPGGRWGDGGGSTKAAGSAGAGVGGCWLGDSCRSAECATSRRGVIGIGREGVLVWYAVKRLDWDAVAMVVPAP